MHKLNGLQYILLFVKFNNKSLMDKIVGATYPRQLFFLLVVCPEQMLMAPLLHNTLGEIATLLFLTYLISVLQILESIFLCKIILFCCIIY